MNAEKLINKYNDTKEWPEYADLKQLDDRQMYLVLRNICKKEHRDAKEVLLCYEVEGHLPDKVHELLLKYTEKLMFDDEEE